MSDLRDLYQEVILDHNKRPRNFRALAPADHQVDGHNPLCGDRLTVYLRLDGGSKGGGLTLDRSRSQGVQAVHDLPQGRYVDLDSSGRSVVCMNPAGLSQKDAGQ